MVKRNRMVANVQGAWRPTGASLSIQVTTSSPGIWIGYLRFKMSVKSFGRSSCHILSMYSAITLAEVT